MDKAGQSYWDQNWTRVPTPEPVDPHDEALGNYVVRRYHDYFSRLFREMDTRGARLLEVGCAKSGWLPYFAREFGFHISGLDYSAVGCAAERELLARHGLDAEIVCADLFNPPESMRESYDVIVSFGVVEHFEKTELCLSALGAMLKPGGLLITTIPNMVGMVGWLQKTFNKPIYDIHRPIDAAMLRQAQESAGLMVEDCGYFLSTKFSVCNLSGIPAHTWPFTLKKWCLNSLTNLSMVAWLLEQRIGRLPAGRWMAPYINCAAKKSAQRIQQPLLGYSRTGSAQEPLSQEPIETLVKIGA